MKIKWDIDELNTFCRRLSNYHELETHLMTATQRIARVLHQYLLVNTPVDTGNLRKMWSAGNNLMFTVKKVAGGFEVELINTAENNGFMYGKAVNYGHRTPSGGWVVGRFFVETSIAQTEVQLKKIVYQELQEWFRWCVNGK